MDNKQVEQVPEDLFLKARTKTNHETLLSGNTEGRIPPPDYRCVICSKKGHFLKMCPVVAKQRTVGLTPYQGNKMCFGKFKCPKCKRQWISSSSWANNGQDCVKCNITVMPHKQWPLEKQNEIPKPLQFHPERLCGLCKQLGYNCRRLNTT